MATFYLDYEGGNDANDGLSFANRWKTFVNGATAARTSSGDTVRVMASPDPTSLGVTGVWTSNQLQNTKSITGATNATPIAITCVAHGYSTGDTVVITGVGGNTSANGTFEITSTGANTFTLDNSVGSGTYTSGGTARLNNNSRVTLASSLTQNIECCGEFTNWTGVTNVTPTLNTTSFKEHRASQQIAIAAGFTTGLACYKALSTTLDLSGYQQVAFWIRQTAGTLASAGAITLRLCSDSAGVTTVNTITIPDIPVLNKWVPVVFDNAAALGSSINSVAFYVETDLAAQTFLIDNIIACKARSAADSLTIASLIGKNTAGESWWPIQSINGSRVMLDAADSSDLVSPTNAAARGYFSTAGYGTETVTTYKRETISTLNHGLGASFAPGNEGGVTYSGGWSITDMSSQTGETWFDNRHTSGICYSAINAANSGLWSKFNAVRFGTGFSAAVVGGGSSFQGFEYCSFTACSVGISVNGQVITSSTILDNLSIYACNTAHNQGGGSSASVSYSQWFTNSNFLSCVLGVTWVTSVAGRVAAQMRFTDCKFSNNTTAVDTNRCNNILFTNNSFLGNDAPVTQSSVANGTNLKFISSTIDTSLTMARPCKWEFIGCTVNQFSGVGTTGAVSWADDVVCRDTTFTNATEIQNQQQDSNCRVYSHNHDNTAGNHKIFTDGGLISAATDQRNTASGISWKLQPTSTARNSDYPLVLSLAKIAVAANSLVTVKAWMRRSNTGLTMRLVCKGGQIAGVASDVVSAMTAAANTWEELTITFTPTEAGVVEITAEAFGGSAFSGWVDDMTISQA